MIKKLLQSKLTNDQVHKIRLLKRRIFYIFDYIKVRKVIKSDQKRFMKNSFGKGKNKDSYEQLEAQITKEYHSIEKGLSYTDMRFGFGEHPIYNLLGVLEKYIENGFPIDTHSYKTAISTLDKYLEVHKKKEKEHLIPVPELAKKVERYRFETCDTGGVTFLNKKELEEKMNGNFEEFSLSRHSVRDYSEQPVSIDKIQKALTLAQNTPSACNRQPWKARVVQDSEKKKIIRNNQNGNRGFGQFIDKFIVITADTQYYAKPRERNQANIDGGMYAMNLLYALHYEGIATVSLSASLMLHQEKTLRKELDISESENFIMFIGIGNYIDEEFKVPRSDRRNVELELI